MPLILDSSSESSINSQPEFLEERRRLHHDADVVIVGAGVLGSVLAVALANQGRSVILLERSLKEPDRIVGELLQPGGVQALTKLGLGHCLDDIDAVPVKGYGVIFHGEQVHIPYPANTARSQSGPQATEKAPRPSAVEGRSFHHGRFVSRLRAAALAHPNISVFETEVTSVITSTHVSQVLGVESLTRKSDRDYFFGALTVICDGYASKFRKPYMQHTPTSESKFWALELIDCALPFPEHGHVLLSDEAAPVLLYQIGQHETRALVAIANDTPTASVAAGGVKAHIQNVVLPSLPASVQPSFKAAIEKGSLRSMPNSFLPSSTNRTPGLAVLGDALNMRHPLTGGGMTVAFNDAVVLTELLSPEAVPDLSDTDLVLRQFHTFHWRRKYLAAVINILAQALYTLFAADDWQLKYLQRGCFQYFRLGGNCVDGPVRLLAALTPQPLVLFYHFFAVAVLSIWVLITENGLWRLPLSLVQSVLVLWKSCVVIFPYIFAEFRS